MGRREQFTVGELTVTNAINLDSRAYIQGAVNPHGAQDYFVDLNMTTASTTVAKAARDLTVDGKSWATAFQTLAAAITASNASIGLTANRWWARRNRIFVCGDEIVEDLTVLPEKTDIIGVGTDLLPRPRLYGQHSFVSKVGVRFQNMGFYSGTGDTGAMMTFIAGAHGLTFEDCEFLAGAAGMTKALSITDCAHVRILNNDFKVGAGSMTNIFGLAIEIAGTASIHDLMIQGNRITATAGITVANGTLMGSLIADNYIRATALCLNDASSDVQVVNNRFISDASDDGSGAGGGALAIKCAILLASGNMMSSSDHRNAPFPIMGTLN